MRNKIQGMLLSILMAPLLVAAQREATPEEEAFFSKAMSQINAKHVRWVKSTATEANQKNLTAEEVQSKAGSYAVLGNISGADIEAIAFLVLMQASKSAQEDLKAIMAQVKSINNQKSKIREALAALDDKNRSITRVRLDSFKLLLKTQPNVKRTNNIPSTREISQVEIDNMRTGLIESRDSLSGIGEERQLRLQILMDRRSKLLTTLSNLMKKISQTQDNIIANLK